MSSTDESWRATYSALDTSTLLALLPVLREGMNKAFAWLKHEDEMNEESEEADTYSAKLWGEALALWDARVTEGDTEAREKLKELRDMVQETLGSQFARTARAKSDSRMQAFLWAHQQRELWIKEELTRRGLLPAFPPE
ncbi:hypothetical protein SMD11_5623 [Streptomyces albireticuli]|uniref:Uncharacterized protein n=1 Tax=Streptomyces albireticuli TaxID=1940 RepID=A0A1Z2LA95_9ACTN|nr:hypothetical protein [Streptomyces albireticuli]ARZ71202.1 hypothetical protein SMD11_5623 [Streptomyces albireticuli]